MLSTLKSQTLRISIFTFFSYLHPDWIVFSTFFFRTAWDVMWQLRGLALNPSIGTDSRRTGGAVKLTVEPRRGLLVCNGRPGHLQASASCTWVTAVTVENTPLFTVAVVRWVFWLINGYGGKTWTFSPPPYPRFFAIHTSVPYFWGNRSLVRLCCSLLYPLCLQVMHRYLYKGWWLFLVVCLLLICLSLVVVCLISSTTLWRIAWKHPPKLFDSIETRRKISSCTTTGAWRKRKSPTVRAAHLLWSTWASRGTERWSSRM